MEVGQGPNWGCNAKGNTKDMITIFLELTRKMLRMYVYLNSIYSDSPGCYLLSLYLY
jgi:hypothetical protein